MPVAVTGENDGDASGFRRVGFDKKTPQPSKPYRVSESEKDPRRQRDEDQGSTRKSQFPSVVGSSRPESLQTEPRTLGAVKKLGAAHFAPDAVIDSMELIRSALGTVPIFLRSHPFQGNRRERDARGPTGSVWSALGRPRGPLSAQSWRSSAEVFESKLPAVFNCRKSRSISSSSSGRTIRGFGAVSFS